MLLDIATAAHRGQAVWSNRQIAWPDLAFKLSRTHRTHETLDQYISFDIRKQSEIKDIGGFVGGYLNDGKRSKRTVRHRQVLTLDADSVEGDLWHDFTMLYAEEALVYSTHKHTPEAPRLRLVMPLSRPVSPEEYEAVGRRIAGSLDIEWFDPTTFQAERLMYWPSTSSDGVFLFERQNGEWLDVDKVLAQYTDWRDISAWPRTVKDKAVHSRDIRKQGEPTEKPGTVGAFCRAFSIEDVIEKFLPDVYETCGTLDRYTYIDGSTAAGAVVYENGKFLFSHHSTDPAGGQLLNAFDLVRLHLFGMHDSQKDREKPIHEQPSYIRMCEWAVTHPEVIEELDDMRELLAQERELGLLPEPEPVKEKPKKSPKPKPRKEKPAPEPVHEDEPDEDMDTEDPSVDWDTAEMDFADLLGVEDTPIEGVTGDNWRHRLDRNKKTGEIKPTISNLRLIMLFDENLKDKIALNEFENFIYAVGDLPWKATDKPRRWEDSDDSGLRDYIENRYGVYHVGKTEDAMVLSAVRNRYHPIREYLDGLEWDGVPRLDTLLIDYLGAEDSPYVRAVTRKSFSAAVARVYRPGCKFDYVLTLVGPEGIKKSGLLTEMGSPWFSDSFQTVTGKEAYEQLQGSWIIEIAELSAFNRAETNAIKAFVTKREDKYRAAYGKHTRSWPRQSVFFATTNEPTFLKGHTGNRRFWPVAVSKRHEPKAKLVNDINSKREVIVGLPVDQLWAEAKYRYKEGEPLYLENVEIEADAKAAQDTYSEVDERVGIVLKFLETPLPKNWNDLDRGERRSYLWDTDEIKAEGVWKRNEVCPMEVWCEGLGMDFRDFNPAKGRELRAIMNMVPGWKYVGELKTFPIYGRQRYFERIDKKETVEQ